MPAHVGIPGAAAGIGAQVAADLATAGRHVWCLDRDAPGLATTVARHINVHCALV